MEIDEDGDSKRRRWNKRTALYSLITIRTKASCLVIFCTVYICRIVEHSISKLFNRSPSSLIVKVPIKACEWFMLGTFVLEE